LLVFELECLNCRWSLLMFGQAVEARQMWDCTLSLLDIGLLGLLY